MPNIQSKEVKRHNLKVGDVITAWKVPNGPTDGTWSLVLEMDQHPLTNVEILQLSMDYKYRINRPVPEVQTPQFQRVTGPELRVGDVVIRWHRGRWHDIDPNNHIPITEIDDHHAHVGTNLATRLSIGADFTYDIKIREAFIEISGNRLQVGDVICEYQFPAGKWITIKYPVAVLCLSAYSAETAIGSWGTNGGTHYKVKRAHSPKIEPVVEPLIPKFAMDEAVTTAQSKMALSDHYKQGCDHRKELPWTSEEREAWSAKLQILVEASAEKDRLDNMVRCDLEFEEWE